MSAKLYIKSAERGTCRSTGTTSSICVGPSYLGHKILSSQSLDLVTKDRGCVCSIGKACRADGKTCGDSMEDVNGMGRESSGDPTGDGRCPDRLVDGDLEAKKAAEWLSDICTLASGLVVSESG